MRAARGGYIFLKISGDKIGKTPTGGKALAQFIFVRWKRGVKGSRSQVRETIFEKRGMGGSLLCIKGLIFSRNLRGERKGRLWGRFGLGLKRHSTDGDRLKAGGGRVERMCEEKRRLPASCRGRSGGKRSGLRRGEGGKNKKNCSRGEPFFCE